MSKAIKPCGGERLVLTADTARDLMHANPISISAGAGVKDVASMLTDKGFSAAPVIDSAGRPVGVVTKTDLVVHLREHAEFASKKPEYFDRGELAKSAGEPIGRGFQVESVDRTKVSDIMTPAVFSVSPDLPAEKVVEHLRALHVHHVFVVDEVGVLIGVISAVDVLKHLR